MFAFDFINPYFGPLWALFGVVLAKLFDLLVARRKAAPEAMAATFAGVNQAQKTLADALFQQIANLSAEVRQLRQALKSCEDQHRSANRRVDELTLELRAFTQTGAPASVQPVATSTEPPYGPKDVS